MSDDTLNWPTDVVEVAKIGEAWGILGWVRIHPYAADAQAVFAAKQWFLKAPEGRPRPSGAPALPPVLNIAQIKVHGDGVVATATEVVGRTAAEALRGVSVFVSRASFPAVRTDEYYWIDLIGLTVVNRAGEELGTVDDLLDTGPHSVLQVVLAGVDADGRPARTERLIPFVAAYIDAVSLADKRIVADWGLDY
jgi:16S rRNA processing protein RimM